MKFLYVFSLSAHRLSTETTHGIFKVLLAAINGSTTKNFVVYMNNTKTRTGTSQTKSVSVFALPV